MSSPARRLSWQAAWAGKTAASRSSERMRWMGVGMRLPPTWRSKANAREAVQRQRVPNTGDWNTACVSSGSAVCALT